MQIEETLEGWYEVSRDGRDEWRKGVGRLKSGSVERAKRGME